MEVTITIHSGFEMPTMTKTEYIYGTIYLLVSQGVQGRLGKD